MNVVNVHGLFLRALKLNVVVIVESYEIIEKKHFKIKLKLFFPTHRVFLIASQILGKKTIENTKKIVWDFPAVSVFSN